MILFNKYKTVDTYYEKYNRIIDIILEDNIEHIISSRSEGYTDNEINISNTPYMLTYRVITTYRNDLNIISYKGYVVMFDMKIYTHSINNKKILYFLPPSDNSYYLKYCINGKLICLVKNDNDIYEKKFINMEYIVKLWNSVYINAGHNCSSFGIDRYFHYSEFKQLMKYLDYKEFYNIYNSVQVSLFGKNILYLYHRIYTLYVLNNYGDNYKKVIKYYISYLKYNIQNIYRWNNSYKINICKDIIRYILIHTNDVNKLIDILIEIYNIRTRKHSKNNSKIYNKIFKFIYNDNIINNIKLPMIRKLKSKICNEYNNMINIEKIIRIYEDVKYFYTMIYKIDNCIGDRRHIIFEYEIFNMKLSNDTNDQNNKNNKNIKTLRKEFFKNLMIKTHKKIEMLHKKLCCIKITNNFIMSDKTLKQLQENVKFKYLALDRYIQPNTDTLSSGLPKIKSLPDMNHIRYSKIYINCITELFKIFELNKIESDI